MNLGPRHWGLALLAAALLHATAGISLILPAQDEGAETSDDTGIEVMLGEAGAANQEAPRPETEPPPRAGTQAPTHAPTQTGTGAAPCATQTRAATQTGTDATATTGTSGRSAARRTCTD